MKAVVQRVKSAVLSCDGAVVSEIGHGLAVYFVVQKEDGIEKASYLAKKIANLRIFNDGQGKMNLSVKDVCGEVLVISQFTLLADVSHGNRPSFSLAEEPNRANDLYLKFIEELTLNGAVCKRGVFGGDMLIAQENDGPVTIIIDSKLKF